MSVTPLPTPGGLVKAAQLMRLAPGAEQRIVAAIVRHADAVLPRYGIVSPLRIAHFMAQIAHESGGFRIEWESMHYSPERIVAVFGTRHSARVGLVEAAQLAGHPEALAERVYGLGNPKKARELGNTHPGDGFRYRGCGLIQITGRANHERYERVVGGPIAEHLLEVAAAFWHDRGCNKLSDGNDLRAVTKRINGGFNGLADRERLFRTAWDIWGDGRSSVRERALAGPKDLKAAGSTIAKGASEVGTIGTATAVAGAAKGVTDAVQPAAPPDLLETVKDVTADLNSARSVMEAAVDTLQWMLAHWWIGALVIGAYLYSKHRVLILARLRNYRLDSA